MFIFVFKWNSLLWNTWIWTNCYFANHQLTFFSRKFLVNFYFVSFKKNKDRWFCWMPNHVLVLLIWCSKWVWSWNRKFFQMPYILQTCCLQIITCSILCNILCLVNNSNMFKILFLKSKLDFFFHDWIHMAER